MKCQECRIGRYREVTLSYISQVGTEIITIPNVSAYVCDMCRQVQYDLGFMLNLQFLLDHMNNAQRDTKQLSLLDELANLQIGVGKFMQE